MMTMGTKTASPKMSWRVSPARGFVVFFSECWFDKPATELKTLQDTMPHGHEEEMRGREGEREVEGSEV